MQYGNFFNQLTKRQIKYSTQVKSPSPTWSPCSDLISEPKTALPSEIRDILKKEVRKGEQADIEEVINLVTRILVRRLNSKLCYKRREPWLKILDQNSNLHAGIVGM